MTRDTERHIARLLKIAEMVDLLPVRGKDVAAANRLIFDLRQAAGRAEASERLIERAEEMAGRYTELETETAR
jgi:hypothetical protein